MIREESHPGYIYTKDQREHHSVDFEEDRHVPATTDLYTLPPLLKEDVKHSSARVVVYFDLPKHSCVGVCLNTQCNANANLVFV